MGSSFTEYRRVGYRVVNTRYGIEAAAKHDGMTDLRRAFEIPAADDYALADHGSAFEIPIDNHHRRGQPRDPFGVAGTNNCALSKLCVGLGELACNKADFAASCSPRVRFGF